MWLITQAARVEGGMVFKYHPSLKKYAPPFPWYRMWGGGLTKPTTLSKKLLELSIDTKDGFQLPPGFEEIYPSSPFIQNTGGGWNQTNPTKQEL